MRYSIIYLLTAACSIFFACTKDIEPPQKVNAVTSYYFKYDNNWKLLESKQSFHWHNLTPENLKQFENKGNDTLCFNGGNTVMIYKMHVDECELK